ncbi:CARDB domain-containing protein [uncultured Thiodictyon sp.]|uniref:RCC1 domain-containing protein n=1 Tax=uncultured Thiodictyon sp. TaxID=1846217 RepID=UPI0025E21BBD|nr:CARDB domain-containing protein [uncultured Thiodictyon sp.]
MSIRSVWRRFTPRPWHAGAIACCCVLVLNQGPGSLAATTATAVTTDAVALTSTVPASDADLRERVARDGWVRVQVDLVQPASAAAPPDPIQTTLLQTDLDQAAQDLLFALPPDSYNLLLRVPGSSSFTLRVDAAGLDGLLASPLVAAVAAAGTADMERIAAGSMYSLAIKPDGDLWAWGNNWFGKLGDGTATDRWRPVQVLTGVAAVAGGANHTLTLRTDGSLWAWGGNDFGQLGNGTTSNDSYTYPSTPTEVLTGVAAVTAGHIHSLAIKIDGSLWTWGYNKFGQLGDGTTTDRSSPLQVLTGVAAVATGGYGHALAIKTDGSLWAWGENTYGQLGDGTHTTRLVPVPVMSGVVAIGAGWGYSMALKTDGSLWAWGHGLLGDGKTTDSLSPILVLSGVTAVTTGVSHTLAIKTDGSLWAWGSNGFGQIGDGTTTNRLSPVHVMDGVSAVAASTSSHTLAMKTDGSLWAWGRNVFGALGDGTATDRWTPVQVVTSSTDFVVTSLVQEPTSPTVAGTFSVAVTVQNRGTAAGTPGTLQVWADQAGTQSCGATGDQSATLTSLAPGASQTVTIKGLPAGAAGAKTLRAFVDSACVTAEANEANNQSTKTYTTVNDVTLTLAKAGTGSGTTGGGGTYAYNTQVTPNARAAPGSTFTGWTPARCGGAFRLTADATCTATFAAGPDFVVTDVVLMPASPLPRGTFSVAVTVKNESQSVGAPGRLQVWANQAATQSCRAMGDRSALLPPLAPGVSRTFMLSGLRAGMAGMAGAKTLRAFVDSDCLTAEANEANNQYTKTYTSFNDVTLTVVKAGTGSGTIGGGGTYRYNTQVTPSARAAPGSTFTGWTPASCGTAFALSADTTCTATFAADNPGSARKGMTWGSAHDNALGIDRIGCGTYCDAYKGETSCSVALPVLCLKVDGSPRPNYAVPTSCPGVAMTCDYYNGWAEGKTAATVPTAGTSLNSVTAGDALCQSQFGAGWRMAEFHDGRRLPGMGLNRLYGSVGDSASPWPTTGTSPGGWAFYAYGNLSPDMRYWVKIDGQPANCWN